MDDLGVVEAVRDALRDSLEDPYNQYNETKRSWIHTDSPLAVATYPRIQIIQREPSSTEIISPGDDFWEWRTLIVDIYFITKIAFKWKDENDRYFKDEDLCKKYVEKIWTTLKSKGRWLHDTHKIRGLKPMDKKYLTVDEDTQFRRGFLSVRLWYFEK